MDVAMLLSPTEKQAVLQTYESGTVRMAAEHVGKNPAALWMARSRARAKLRAAGLDLPDLRRQRRSGCKRIPAREVS